MERARYIQFAVIDPQDEAPINVNITTREILICTILETGKLSGNTSVLALSSPDDQVTNS